MDVLGDKGKVYVQDLSAAPRGARLQQGPRGGTYYEADAAGNPVGAPPGGGGSSQRIKLPASKKPPAAPKGRAAATAKEPKPTKRQPGQPFGGPDDAGLPSRVRNESANVRAGWVSQFNRTLRAGGSEADALAAANQQLPRRSAAPTRAPARAVGQPFKGPADPGLPRRVAAEAPAVRADWVNTFNAALKLGNSEAEATRGANERLKRPSSKPAAPRPRVPSRPPPAPRGAPAASNKVQQLAQAITDVLGGKAVMEDELDYDEDGEKCGPDMPVMAMYKPAGGATSFDELDRYEAAHEAQEEVEELTRGFRAIVDNIFGDDMLELPAKASAVARAAADLKTRIGAIDTANPSEKALDDDSQITPPPHESSGVLGRLWHLGQRQMMKAEGGVKLRASDYADVGDPEKVSTWHMPLVSGKSGGFDLGQIAMAITAMQPGGFRGNPVQMAGAKPAAVARINAAISKAPGDDAKKEALRARLAKVKEVDWGQSEAGAFKSYLGEDGAWHWMAIWSNKFEDRQKEMFSDAAHKEYEQWVDQSGSLPALRLWHLPGSDIGKADCVAYDDRGFMLATGVYDSAHQSAAKALADYPEPLGVSHGFVYKASDRVDGVYNRYRAFEISVLPLEAAANPLTAFVAQEDPMSLSSKKKEFVTRALGEKAAAELEGHIGLLAKKASEEGIAFKDITDLLEEQATAAAPAPVPSPAPAAPPAPVAAAPDEDALTKAFKAATAPLLEQIKALADEVTKLKASDDEKIAGIITPRIIPGGVAAKAATASDGNVANGNSADVKAAKEAAAGGAEGASDWYFKAMPFKGLDQAS